MFYDLFFIIFIKIKWYEAQLIISNVHLFLRSPSARPKVFFFCLPFARPAMALLLKECLRVAVFVLL